MISTACATSCQEYPLEYAYRDDSVTRTESVNANCRRYSGWYSENYIHCDGIHLRLADSNFGPRFGQEQYHRYPTDYYEWPAGHDEQLLFIFPTTVSLTTITLHYCSDSVRGLPRLRFYNVPDDFDVWNALTSGTPYVGVASVPPYHQYYGEPAGRKNISINANFNTKRVAMYKYSSNFQFAVSEVEFFTRCNGE